jgi:hypothetical protein
MLSKLVSQVQSCRGFLPAYDIYSNKPRTRQEKSDQHDGSLGCVSNSLAVWLFIVISVTTTMTTPTTSPALEPVGSHDVRWSRVFCVVHFNHQMVPVSWKHRDSIWWGLSMESIPTVRHPTSWTPSSTSIQSSSKFLTALVTTKLS